MATLKGPVLVDDAPVRVATDLSEGSRALVSKLWSLVERDASGPILVSGSWGAGKTSILRSCQSLLDLETLQAGRRPRTAFFEAWHYENGAGLMPALIRSLWEVAKADPVDTGAGDGKAWANLWRCGLVVATKAAPVVAAAFGMSPLIEAAKALRLKDLADDLRVAEDALGTHPPADPVAEIREKFAVLVRSTWPDPALVVFIDDLDRCSPEGAVTLLEGIRMLVSGTSSCPCRFVVALDRELLVEAIGQKFAGIPSFDGNRYLEKVFPLEFHVPTPDPAETQRLVKRLLSECFENPSSHSGTHAEAIEALGGALGDPAFSNPRLIKRVINTYLLVLAERSLGDGSAAVTRNAAWDSEATLAKWIVATKRWPALRQLMHRFDERSWAEVGAALANAGAAVSDPEAQRLLSEPGALPWLRSAGLGEDGQPCIARFREADERLRRIGL